eukprot:TRINITY_DN12265_c0_g1_i2.p1 TRINITY_DN12265_c0_g1~~TRINITY_DN12265_c0_g1_i2.p1  ORF type:complete len:115 (-),score=25.01 TRINITY_DN12265_c0_g1_i2:34-378(-)
MKCGNLRKEERELRQYQRSEKGLGRGGGYYERDEDSSKDDHSRRETSDAKKSRPRNGLDAPAAALPTSKAERQKAALARLGQKKLLSPPRRSHFREKSSRSRSMERRRESVRWR